MTPGSGLCVAEEHEIVMSELYLVEFRGSRREYFFNSYYHMLEGVQWVIVQAERGEDIGRLSHKVAKEGDFVP